MSSWSSVTRRCALCARSARRAVVGQQVGDGVRHHVGVPGGDEDPGVTEDLGDGALVEGDHGQAGRHGLDDGDTEAFVLGGHHEDVGGGVGLGHGGVAGVALEADGIEQTEFGDVAPECLVVGVGRRLPDDAEGGGRDRAGAG